MATEAVANLLELVKEVWTQDRLERQFYPGTRWLDKVEKTNKYTIGRQAQVPLELSLPGGDSSVPTAGSSALNAADDLNVDRADYTLTQQWRQIAIEAAALNQADSVGMRTVVDAQDQTIKSNVLGMRKNINRQVVTNGDALIAGTLAGAANTTILLDPAKYGYDAVQRGWLRVGQQVDVGTTANEVSVGDGVLITAVDKTPAAPTLTVDSSVTETASTFVSIKDARAGTTSNETNGLRTIVGSASSTIGTLAPASVPQWQPALVDTATTVVSLDLLLRLQTAVYQETGEWPSYVTTSPKQASNLYAAFQNQVRFTGDGSTNAGNVSGFNWNGIDIAIDPDIPNQELYMLNLSDFFVVTGGKYGKPTWASDIEGSGGRLRWTQGTTKFVDGLYYSLQLAVKARHTHASATGLTA